MSQTLLKSPQRSGFARSACKFRWIIAQEGTRETYAIPISFHRLGELRLFYVDVWCRRGRDLLRRGPAATRALATHYVAEIPSERVVSFNQWAIPDRVCQHFTRGRSSPRQRADRFCRFGERFATAVRNHLQTIELDPARDRFFGFNTNCLETLELLRQRGVFSVVDQVDPGLAEEEIVLAEVERWPGWAMFPGRMPESYWDRLKAEWELADIILVNSTWSGNALVKQGVPRDKLIVVPLAVDLHHDQPPQIVKAQGPLKVLWLGSIILRKGIPYLIEAARRLANQSIEFLLAGPLGISLEAVRTFPPNVKLLGRVTRDQLSQIYRQSHVFVLPTISDGFAITQLEAMAHGLPVIATPNCGQVVTHGIDGFVVPARDGQALADAIARLHHNRPLLQAMSVNAPKTVQKYDLSSNARLINQLVAEKHGLCSSLR